MSRWKLPVIGLLLISLMILGVACQRPAAKKNKPKSKTSGTLPKSNLVTSPLDGEKVKPELVDRQALAVMVENLNTVRPQAGIAQAAMVVEGLSEGGITRFMLVYLEQDVNNIGPVRSARTHFVVLAKGLKALYAHVGGSTFGLAAIKQYQVDDLDQFTNSTGYHRVTSAKAPHNVFTSTAALRALKPTRNLPPPAFTFKNDAAEAKRPAQQKISINFSFPNYAVVWEYQPKTNTYLRFNGGKPHTDAATGKQMETKNIVIMYAPTSPIAGTDLLDINTVGSGPIKVIRDGSVVAGTWSKPSAEGALRFRDGSGAEIKLDRGQVWLELVAPTTTVVISGAPAANAGGSH